MDLIFYFMIGFVGASISKCQKSYYIGLGVALCMTIYNLIKLSWGGVLWAKQQMT